MAADPPWPPGRVRTAHGTAELLADADRDGRVSLAEAQNAAVRHFDMMDANRDGTVTREERRGMRQRMRAMHGRQPG